jgi:hypothetical protein
VFICGINDRHKAGHAGRRPNKGECKQRFQTLNQLLIHITRAHPGCGTRLRPPESTEQALERTLLRGISG